MDWVWQALAREWLAVTTTPFLFIAALAPAILAAWLAANLYYRSSLASKDAEISLIVRQRDDYKDKLNGATPEEASAKIADLERRLLLLEPRRLTDKQRDTIKRCLLSYHNQKHLLAVVHDVACPDGNIYAADISSVIKSLPGWTVTEPAVMAPMIKSPKGVAIISPNEPVIEPIQAPLDPTTELIAQSFLKADIQFDIIRGGKLAPLGMPQIMITARIF